MEKENISWNEEDELKAENDFLKMKLMLENGAEFHTIEGSILPPGIENQFLKNIASFEEQWAKRKTITVYEKIERPMHFLPVSHIPDEEIEGYWSQLLEYLQGYGIHLDHCSPRVTSRELYRFTTEELFQLEIDDMDVPGMMRGFIYDEFYPDPAFDLCIIVENIIFWNIFQKGETRMHRLFEGRKFSFNDGPPMDASQFVKSIDGFKDQFVELSMKEFKVLISEVEKDEAHLQGCYRAEASRSNDIKYFEGEFMVRLERAGEDWELVELRVEGLELG